MRLSLILTFLALAQITGLCADESIIKAIQAGNWSEVNINPTFIHSDYARSDPCIGIRRPSLLGPKNRYILYHIYMANTKGRKFPVDVLVREEVSRVVKHEKVAPLLAAIVKALRYPRPYKVEVPIRSFRVEFIGGDSHDRRVVDCFPPTEKDLSDMMTLLKNYSKQLRQNK